LLAYLPTYILNLDNLTVVIIVGYLYVSDCRFSLLNNFISVYQIRFIVVICGVTSVVSDHYTHSAMDGIAME